MDLPVIDTLEAYADQLRDTLLEWITSPAAYAELGLLMVAYFLAVAASAWLRPRLQKIERPPASYLEERAGKQVASEHSR